MVTLAWQYCHKEALPGNNLAREFNELFFVDHSAECSHFIFEHSYACLVRHLLSAYFAVSMQGCIWAHQGAVHNSNLIGLSKLSCDFHLEVSHKHVELHKTDII